MGAISRKRGVKLNKNSDEYSTYVHVSPLTACCGSTIATTSSVQWFDLKLKLMNSYAHCVLRNDNRDAVVTRLVLGIVPTEYDHSHLPITAHGVAI